MLRAVAMDKLHVAGPDRIVILRDRRKIFVFDGIRKAAPKLEYVGASVVLKAAGVASTPGSGR